MAGGAGHFALTQRMMRRLEEIGVLRLMTARAHIDLGGRGQYRILGRVQRVAACAGHVVRRVGTDRPVMGSIQLMAAKTLCVLPGDRSQRLGAEVEHAGQRAALRTHMCTARPVAGLALQAAVPEGTVWIIRTGVLGTEYSCGRRIVMAAEAGIRSLRTVRRRRIG